MCGPIDFSGRKFQLFFESRVLGEPGIGVACIIEYMYSREYSAYSSAIGLRVEAPNCKGAQIFRDTSTGRILRLTNFLHGNTVKYIHRHLHAKGMVSPMPASAGNSIFLGLSIFFFYV